MTIQTPLRRRGLAGLLLTVASLIPGARADTPPRHRLVLHVDQNDAQVMNEALNNLLNALDDYSSRGDAIAVELVANGSGYAMLRDISPVRERIAKIHTDYPAVQFSACQNSRRGIAQREGKTPEQIIELPAAIDVPAGIARLVELQEAGWSYVKV